MYPKRALMVLVMISNSSKDLSIGNRNCKDSIKHVDDNPIITIFSNKFDLFFNNNGKIIPIGNNNKILIVMLYMLKYAIASCP